MNANAEQFPPTPDAQPLPDCSNVCIRAVIDHGGDGTTVSGTDRQDVDVREQLRRLGFRWSRRLQVWFLPRTWTEATRRGRVDDLVAHLGGAAQLEDAGPAMTSTAQERVAEHTGNAAARAERSAARSRRLLEESEAQYARSAEIVETIPLGQPILVGHHSERRHRRDLDRSQAAADRGADLAQQARTAARRASSARAEADGYDRPDRLHRRLETSTAEIRRLRRILDGTGRGIHGQDAPLEEGVHRDQLEARLDELVDLVDRDQALAAELVLPDASTVSPGDLVRVRNTWCTVVRANTKTVTVRPFDRVQATHRRPYAELTAHVPVPAGATHHSSDGRFWRTPGDAPQVWNAAGGWEAHDVPGDAIMRELPTS